MIGKKATRKVLERLLQDSSGINTEHSSTQSRVDEAVKQILAITIDEDKKKRWLRRINNIIEFGGLPFNSSESLEELYIEIASSDIFKDVK